jgi:filamentous hemagglutinin
MSVGGQTITARAIDLTAQNGRKANIENTIGEQSVIASAGDMKLQVPGGFGVAQIINTAAGANQTVRATGQLDVLGGVITPTTSRNSGIFKNGAGGLQTVSAAGITLQGASSGTSAGAAISSQGDQLVDVSGGTINLRGGDGGTGNNASIGAAATGQQTILVRDINLSNGVGGTDTAATIVGGHQLIDATGNVTLTAQGSLVSSSTAPLPGVRIGAPGGTGTDLTLRVDGHLVLNGGTAPDNGASIGSSGSGAAQQNTISIEAGGSVVLNSGGAPGAGARIGSSSQNGLAGGDISIEAGGSIELNGTGSATAIRTLGNVTLDAASVSESSNGFVVANALNVTTDGAANLAGPNEVARFSASSGGALTFVDAGSLQVSGIDTTNDAITLTTDSLINEGLITNGGSASTANIILSADAFDLAGGAIEGGAAAVILRPRTGTNSFGVESAGQTTVGNADLASIHTSNVVVFGSGTGTIFTGDMTIGQNARVEGGDRNLAFFRSSAPGGTTTIGMNGVNTSGNLIVSAGGGAIVSHGGTVSGDQVQLRASQGIGSAAARVQTSANRLALNNTGPQGAFVFEAGDVTLGNVNLTVGGIGNNVGNFSGGTLDLSAGGTLGVTDVVSSFGGQTITAQNVNVSAQGGRTAQLLNTVGNQTITAGNIDVQTGAGGGLAEIRNNSAGQQQITVTGDHLNVHGLGGGVANVFASGNQLIQTTSAGPRSIALGSEAALGASTINAGGDQTITGRPDIIMTGGAGPVENGHNALIVAFNPTRTQRIEAGDISMANSTLGGLSSVAAINGANQVIDATGDVTLTANASLGSLPGVRIGGLAGGSPSGTNLMLSVGGDLVLTGGTLAGNGVGIGSTASPTAPALANNITINAPNGDVILNSGVAGSGVRIGAPQTTGGVQSGGNIAITAGGEIRLNGVDEFASIRTRDNVTLSAASITEAQNGRVIAGTLSTNTSGNTLLTGPNEVFTLNALSGGDFTLNNTGALTVTGLNAANAALTNAGDVTVSGPWNTFGTTSISIGSDLNVNNNVQSSGPMNLNVDGTVRVMGSGVQDASLASFGGQTINARSLEVTSLDGRFVSVRNTGPSAQTINLSNGAGLDVQTLSLGGFAQVSAEAGGSQTINVVNGDHISVNGVGGAAMIAAFGGPQTISMTGGGANAIRLGSSGAFGSSQIAPASTQSVIAGLAGEQGSITIVGPAANAAAASIVSNSGPGGTQTISTSGLLSITGGSAPNQTLTSGVFHNGSGAQTITATGISVTGGPGGNGNRAQIGSFGGGVPANAGHQILNVAGGEISLRGSDAGSMNVASIFSNADQTINGNPDLVLVSGASAVPGVPTGNVAAINTVLGRSQTIHAGTITMTNSATANTDSFAGINATQQQITTTGDVVLIANGGSARIGGQGAGPTNLQLTVGGNLVLDGGSQPTNGAGIGSTGLGAAFPNNINIVSAGDVILNSGASGARIGSAAATGTAGGNISISASSIQLNGTGASAAIRTLGNVTLDAASISEAGNGFILANTLGTTTTGNTSLTGPNQVAVYNGTAGSDLTFNNASALNVVAVNAGGTATLTAAGAMSVSGPVAADSVALTANGGGIDQFAGGAIAANSLTTVSAGDTTLNGANQVAAFNATSTGGDVTLNNSGALEVTGMNAFGDATITNLGDVTVSGPWTAGGTSAITVGSSIFLKSHMQSHDVQLVSTTGDIVQDAGASIDAVSLTTSSFGDTQLEGTNVVETVVSDTGGDLSLHTVSALLKLSGMHLPGMLKVDNTGAIAITGEVSALSHNLHATGDITIGGADAAGATLLHAPGFITISTPGSIWVRGSDTSAGAGSAVLAGGALSLNASNVTLLGGGAALTPVLARGEVVNMAVGNLNVMGGRGHLSPAWLSSGTDINLTVGDAVRLQTGSGLLSWARVQTETRDGEIRLTFPSRSEGGYFVDGIEDSVKHGQTGFYTLLKPVKVGDTLILTYEGE